MNELSQRSCPRCDSRTLEIFRCYEAKHHGDRNLYRCGDCGEVFSQTWGTFLEGLKQPLSKLVAGLKARREGLGVNATCRVFEMAKNTLLDWERRFAK
jgi:transposase-like protein